MKTILLRAFLLLSLTLAASALPVSAQHVFGVKAGYGMGSARFYPKQETHSVWGMYTGGITWRYYSAQRFVGAVGVDIEFLQRGYSYSPNSLSPELRYTRRLNSVMIPIVWQPHLYAARNRLRITLDLAVTFSYNFSSRYENQLTGASGPYPFKNVRDNRLGYGLAGGPGIAYLAGRLEIGLAARYYFGYADILRNRNRYADNATDDPSLNPFERTPLRSPLDNVTITVGISYRMGKGGFKSLENRRPRRTKPLRQEFDDHFGHPSGRNPQSIDNR